MSSDYEQVTALEWARTKAKWFFSAMAVVMVGALFFGLQTGRVECGSNTKDPRATYAEEQKAAVATVADSEIARGEFERYYQRIKNSQSANMPPGTLVDPMQDWQLKAQAISALISSELLEQKALEHGITPDPEKVKEQMKLAEANLLPPLATPANQSILQKVGTTLQEKKRRNQFASAVAKLTGLTMSEFEHMLELQIIQQDYEEILKTEAEKSVKEDALKEIEAIRTEAEADGAVFAAIAKEKSQDPETKDVGGRIDLLSAAQMINDYGQEYVDILRNTAPGTIAKPIFSPADKRNGYFLVKLDTFKRAEGPEFEAEKESVRQKILDKKREQATADAESGLKVDATEDEIRDAYETASLWQIFIPVGNPDQAFADKFEQLLDDAQIEVLEPELKAGFLWMVREDPEGALKSMEAALEQLKQEQATELADVEDADTKESMELTQDLDQAAMHYVLGQIEAMIPDQADEKRIREFFEANQNNLDAFSSFPEPSEDEAAAAKVHRENALKHYETSYTLDPQRPWTPIAIAQMLVRLELKDRYSEAVDYVAEGLEYASLDLQTHQRAQQVLTSIQGALDETQTDLKTKVDELLTTVSTKIADIQKKAEDFQKKQQEEMQAMLDQSKPETQAEMTPEEEAPPAAPVDEGAAPVEVPVEVPVEGAPPADAPAEGTAEGTAPQ